MKTVLAPYKVGGKEGTLNKTYCTVGGSLNWALRPSGTQRKEKLTRLGFATGHS